MMTALDTAVELFTTQFGGEPDGVWEAPGRVNLIGEHTDYNQGLVLPIALPQRTYAVARARADRVVRCVSDGMDPGIPVDLDDIAVGHPSQWERYPVGVMWALREAGHELAGMDVAFASDVPVGAGLSSSAAIEGAMGAAASDLFGLGLLDDDEGRSVLATVCQRAENVIAQAPTGGMDQAASIRSKQGHALCLDCQDGSVAHVPFRLSEAGLALLVVNTRVSHSHSDGEYGSRRAQCEQACARLGIDSLREITPQTLPVALARLNDDVLARRVRHVVTETERVRLAARALADDDFVELGRLFVDSHASMRDDYEISCPELDLSVVTALEAGALGARMTGGGFGGSSIAVVYAAHLEQTMNQVASAFDAAGHAAPEFIVAQAGPPARRTA
ncbi:MAG: galactokinase [Propionibacteriaceae bacterium]|jgi:galactokinase|nr:galactokinase [Propionibacteriaceae bacterium]